MSNAKYISSIPINEAKLLAHNICFLLILFFLVSIAVAAFFIFRCQENRKSKDRMKHLRIESETDPYAKKQLNKLERKQRKRVKNDVVTKVIPFSLLLVLILINLFVAVIPGWIDYIKKDYVIYGGQTGEEYEVRRYTRNSFIILQDGTKINGAIGLDDGIHNERIVYSKRTKIVLGKENSGYQN